MLYYYGTAGDRISMLQMLETDSKVYTNLPVENQMLVKEMGDNV
jgi:hypothetical protein